MVRYTETDTQSEKWSQAEPGPGALQCSSGHLPPTVPPRLLLAPQSPTATPISFSSCENWTERKHRLTWARANDQLDETLSSAMPGRDSNSSPLESTHDDVEGQVGEDLQGYGSSFGSRRESCHGRNGRDDEDHGDLELSIGWTEFGDERTDNTALI
jgi:hypothetical protein